MESGTAECLKLALRSGGDFAELYLEDKAEWSLRAGEGPARTHTRGAAIRVFRGGRAVDAFSGDMTREGLIRLAENAAELLSLTGDAGAPGSARIADTIAFPMAGDAFPARAEAEKFLTDEEKRARGAGIPLRMLELSLSGTRQDVRIYNTEGASVQETREYTRLRVRAAAERGREIKSDWGERNLTAPFSPAFIETGAGYAEMMARDLNASMDAQPVKSRRVPVIMEGGCGTLWHEACGHMLEAPAILDGSSPFAGRLGEKLASDRVTLLDDGTIKGLYGTRLFDDEGMPCARNLLIDRGILRGYLCDRLGARRLNLPPNGAGRRQGYAYPPSARMSNTYLAAGEDDEDEMLRTIPDGLYIRRLGGGNSGRTFSVAVSEGYLIKNGELSDRVKNLTLSGSGEELLKRIDRVGKKQVYEESGSFCGSLYSGLVPVTAFQPRVRVSEMNVAGEG